MHAELPRATVRASHGRQSAILRDSESVIGGRRTRTLPSGSRCHEEPPVLRSVAAKTHWLLDERTLPTGQTEPITNILPDPKNVAVKDVTLDDIFTDLERDERGLATMSLKGKSQQIDVVLGPKFKTILVLSRVGGGRGRGGAGAAPAAQGAPVAAPAARGSVAFEPMAGISNSMNLAQKGLYKELQTIEPGGFWEESFWVRPKGY